MVRGCDAWTGKTFGLPSGDCLLSLAHAHKAILQSATASPAETIAQLAEAARVPNVEVHSRLPAILGRVLHAKTTYRSLRQTGFSQTLFQLGEILGPVKWIHILEIGNPQHRIELAHMPHWFPRFLQPSAKRAARCKETQCGHPIRAMV